MKRFALIIVLFPLFAQAEQKELNIEITDNNPKIGIETEVYLGDRMLAQGVGKWKECITPKQTFTKTRIGWTKIIKADEPLCKREGDDKYYWSDYDNAYGQGTTARYKVRWKQNKNKSSLCQCQMGMCVDCFKKLNEDDVEYGERFVHVENSLQQTIEYSGKQGELLNFLYSEFYSGTTRDAFNREFTLHCCPVNFHSITI